MGCKQQETFLMRTIEYDIDKRQESNGRNLSLGEQEELKTMKPPQDAPPWPPLNTSSHKGLGTANTAQLPRSPFCVCALQDSRKSENERTRVECCQQKGNARRKIFRSVTVCLCMRGSTRIFFVVVAASGPLIACCHYCSLSRYRSSCASLLLSPEHPIEHGISTDPRSCTCHCNVSRDRLRKNSTVVFIWFFGHF
jgi:hypothetical protein